MARRFLVLRLPLPTVILFVTRPVTDVCSYGQAILGLCRLFVIYSELPGR